MQITPIGAAGTVTGSSYLIENGLGECFLVDCGMFQGGRRMEERNWASENYRPQELKGILITHAHIDHSGLVPRLVRMGFQGPVYATKATCELLKILWADSAHIQEMEARWQTRKNKRRGKKEIEPLYEAIDAQEAAKLVMPVELGSDVEVTPWASAHFVSAGHILGAASLLVTLDGSDGMRRVGFSGDIGRPQQLIVPDPEALPKPDMLFMETTYGGRLHKSLDRSQEELLECVHDAYANNGKVLIPCFAVERTQEIIYTLAAAHRRGEFPKDMPIFLDSPLAIKATNIFREHPEFFDLETKEILEDGNTPLNLPNLTPTLSTEESQNINNHQGPAVIIAGNGMASAGRIKHHLKHNLWRPATHVVLVGFQAQGTTGRLLAEGADKVKIFREEVVVRAKVATINGFSAHADQKELLNWLEPMAHKDLTVNLIHGEQSQSQAFKEAAHKKYPSILFRLPQAGKPISVAPSALPEEELAAEAAAAAAPAPAAPAPEPAPLTGEALLSKRVEKIYRGLGEIMVRLQGAGEELSPEELAALESGLGAAEKMLDAQEAA